MTPEPLYHRPIEADGNRFVLVDGLLGPLPSDPAAHARAVCHEGTKVHDGVLHLDRNQKGQLRMVLYNRDGSRPQTCGNGLRCLAWHAVDVGHEACGEFEIETDAGLCIAKVLTERGESLRVRVAIGPLALEGSVDLDGPVKEGWAVNCGNPHLVLFGCDLSDQEIANFGPSLVIDPSFTEGVNVEFVRLDSSGLHMRVFERGVGETLACGTGACAVAWAAVGRGMLQWPVSVTLRGGTLTLSPGPWESWLWLEGQVSAGAGVRLAPTH